MCNNNLREIRIIVTFFYLLDVSVIVRFKACMTDIKVEQLITHHHTAVSIKVNKLLDMEIY